jgi:hypothetical protein
MSLFKKPPLMRERGEGRAWGMARPRSGFLQREQAPPQRGEG